MWHPDGDRREVSTALPDAGLGEVYQGIAATAVVAEFAGPRKAVEGEMRGWRFALLLAAVAVIGAGCGSATGGGGGTLAARSHDALCNFVAKPPATYKHVIWIWFDARDAQDVLASSNAGSYTNDLADRCGLAENYHNISYPRVPNYVAATSGSVQGDASDSDCRPSACPQSQTSIFDQVQASGRQWRDYVQTPEGVCAESPAAWYPSVAANCKQWEETLGSPASGNLHDDLAADTLPAFAFVNPDAPTADGFLNDWIPAISASAAYKAGSVAVFITWDDGGGTLTPGEACDDHAHANSTRYPACQVALIAIAPSAGATRSSEYFTHYSLLRTTEEMLGISTYLGGAASEQSMRTALHL